MIAAIYARKSPDLKQKQHADADARSVARQIENAKAFARGKGWTVLDDYVFSDEFVSGGDVKKQIGRQRLLDLIHGKSCPFQVLVIRDESRFSRRDGDVSFSELKQISKAGVQVWFYQTGEPFKFGDLQSNVIGLFKGEIAAEYRRQVGRLTSEALVRKFKDGYVTGGRVFGYDNVRVNGHTERRINPAEAIVIRTIFKLYAQGYGYTRIARHLNAEGAPAPLPRADGRSASWYNRTVGLVLHRDLYRGIVTFGRQQSKAADGTRIDANRPRDQWLIADRPDLRIVTDAQWNAAHQRKTAAAEKYAAAGFKPGRRRDGNSRYLLPGFARCSICGGSVGVVNGSYQCLRNHLRGVDGCAAKTRVKVPAVDAAVRGEIAKLLEPATIMLAVERAQKALASRNVSKDLKSHQKALQALDRKAANLAQAIAEGGRLEVLVKLLGANEAERERTKATILALESVDVTSLDKHVSKKELAQRSERWRRLLAAIVADARQALRRMLAGPLVMVPDGRNQFKFSGELALGQVIAGDSNPPINLPGSSARSIDWSLKFSGIAA